MPPDPRALAALSPHLFPLWVSLYASLSFCLCVSVFEPLLVSLLVSLSICTASHSASLGFRLSLSVTLFLSVSDPLGHNFFFFWDTLLTGAQTPSAARPQPPTP